MRVYQASLLVGKLGTVHKSYQQFLSSLYELQVVALWIVIKHSSLVKFNMQHAPCSLSNISSPPHFVMMFLILVALVSLVLQKRI